MSASDIPEGIAIIGMAGRFPGAPNIEVFWENLSKGIDSITHFADSELEVGDTLIHQPNYIKARGVLTEVDLFDAAFFGYTTRDSELMDPQQRVFLECAWEALENAGCDPDRFSGLIGVYAGCSLNTYLLHNLCTNRNYIEKTLAGHQTSANPALLGNDKDFLATRVAYKLNLRGPSLAVQTACSTSLVAVCEAYHSLLSFQCDIALAGGVSISFPQRRGYEYLEGAMASSDGRCRPFDAAAEGTVFGGGAGVVVLRRLVDAIEAGDNIIAVIKGAAINNDGAAKVSYMAPSVEGQADVITMAQEIAGFLPETIGYVEAHGTGTPLGDPIEIAALTKAFRVRTDATGFCGIGSVKSNVGHLEAAAGVTGLIKGALTVQHGLIPPTLHFTKPNPKCEFEKSPFFVVSKPTEWRAGTTPRRAGVSSFGVGGTNAHVVIEESPAQEIEAAVRPGYLFLLSARTASALEMTSDRLRQHLESHKGLNLADVAYTLQAGRRAFKHRRAFVCREVHEAVELLGSKDPKRVFSRNPERSDPPVVFLFPGQGVQQVNMGRDLYNSEPVFREEIDRCSQILQRHLNLDLRTVLYPPEGAEEQANTLLTQTWLTQPVLFVVEYSLARLWISWGVRPAAMLGHSVGEYVAACLAEVFTLEDALYLLAARARLMQDLPPGAMLAIRASEKEVLPLLENEIALAAVNSPRLCVVSGPIPHVEKLASRLLQDGVASRMLRTSHAFHSAMMDPIAEPFIAIVRQVPRSAPRIPYLSNLTADWISEEQTRDAAYWFNHLRRSVRFADCVAELARDTGRVFLEVGPGQTLRTLVRQHSGIGADQPVLASLPSLTEQDERESILRATGHLWLAGVAVDWAGFHRGERRRKVPLPSYPFERKRYWVEAPQSSTPSMPVQQDESRASPGMRTEASVNHNNLDKENSAVMDEHPLKANVVASCGTRRDHVISLLHDLFREVSGEDYLQSCSSATFIEMGLDSLMLTQTSQSIQKNFLVKVTFRQLMEELSTFESLATYLDANLPPDSPVVTMFQSSEHTERMSSGSTDLPISTPTKPVVQIPIGADASLIERIVNEQLRVMEQQLAMLRGVGKTTSPTGSLAVTATPRPVVTAVKSGEEDVSRFGPFRAIERGTTGGLTPSQQKALENLIARYNKRTAGSKRMAQENRAHFSDPRAAGNFRQLWKEMVYPIVCARSEGSRLWDIDGNEYVDVTMGFGANYLGHSPDFVMRALEEQMKKGIEIGPQSPLAGENAKLICELTGMERATFCNTGSEAVVAAIRVARTVTGRDKIVYFRGDYHGINDELLGRPALVDGRPGAMPIAPGIPPLSNVMVLAYDNPVALETIKSHAADIAAVIVEPVQARHPDLQPQEFLHELRRVTEQNEIALVFDEVITGFRVALGGAQEYFGVRADLATYGKVIGGGMPIGVLAGKAKFMDALDGGQWCYGDDSFPEVGVTFFAGTFVRHPLAMAAANVVLKHLRAAGSSLQRAVNERTARFVQAFNAYSQERELPMRLQAFSALFYYDFHPELTHAGLLFYYLRDRGVHIWEGRVGHFSTAHTDQDIEFVLDAFKDCVAEMQNAGFLPVRVGNKPAQTIEASHHEIVSPTTSTDTFPLTEAQKEMWLAVQMGPGASAAFNESTSIHFRGPLNLSAMQRAIQGVINRHEALRCTFSSDGTVMRFQPSLSIDVPFLDFSGLPPMEREKQVVATLEQEGRRVFDLAKGPLVAMQLLKFASNEHVLVFTAHHIACDGWSYDIVVRDLSLLYSAYVEGRTCPLKPPLQMRDYALWEQKERQTAEADECEKYWLSQFKTVPPPLELPSYRSRPPARTYDGARLERLLPQELYQAIKLVGKQQKSTSFTMLLAAFQTMLHRLTGLDDIVVGIQVAGQNSIGSDDLVGHCANTLPIRVKIDSTEPFANLLGKTRSIVMDAFEHQNYTFGTLIQKITLPRDPSRIPLVPVIFNLDPPMSKVRFGGLEHQISLNPRHHYQFDLGFNLVEEDNALRVECDYNTNLFDDETITRWLGHYQTLLEGIAAGPITQIGWLPILTAAERDQILNVWNRTERDYPREKCIHELFEEQAARTPDAVAIVVGAQQLIYGELNQRANMLASHLREKGIAPGAIVGIYMERSLEMMVGLIAILKAGGAYLPLDHTYPADRIAFMLDDAKATVLLTQSSLVNDLPAHQAHVVCVDTEWNIISAKTAENVNSGITPQHPSYVIYTSGSTGKPKGVVVCHGNVVNFFTGMDELIPYQPAGVWLAVTSISFDIHVLELFWTLTHGFKIIIHSEQLRSVKLPYPPVGNKERSTEPSASIMSAEDYSLPAKIRRYDVSHFQCTPSMAGMLLSDEEARSALRSIKIFMVGGEALPTVLAAQLRQTLSGPVLNMYGPTETTIWSTTYVVSDEPGAIPIGRPIANTDIYILDRNMQPVSVGIAGELFIGGEGVARGYLNRPELTAERFIQNPFNGLLSARLYRTGDLARYRPDGNIEYLGRIDNQVKIRGHRIELGEIETRLLLHPQVKQAVVVAVEEAADQKDLAAYIVSKNDVPIQLLPSSPSVAGAQLYDDTMYDLMANDERRNQCFMEAFRRTVKNKVVVDIGTGKDALLARLVMEAGAKKVYAIEILEEPYRQAVALVRRLGLGNRITVLQGDSTKINLPEKVDVAVAENVGHIGGAEGLELLLKDAQRHLKTGGQIIPNRAVTHIAAVSLPQDFLSDPCFSQLGAAYTEGIFSALGYRYDLRLSITGTSPRYLCSTTGVFESCDFTNPTNIEYQNELNLTITKSGPIDGFLLWLNIHMAPGLLLDCMKDQDSWVPVYLPVFSPEIEVKEGDEISAVVTASLADNKWNKDYIIKGYIKRGDTRIKEFTFNSLHYGRVYRNTPFYQRLFKNDTLPVTQLVPLTNLSVWLKKDLPAHMVPTTITILEKMPLTPNGKIDRRALPKPSVSAHHQDEAYVQPRDAMELELAKLWSNLLGVKNVGLRDNFFDLGGHSLKGVQLFSELEKITGKRLPLATLFEAPTIGQLAEVLRRGQTKKTFESLVPIQASGTKPPLFLVHGAGGNVLLYRYLAKHIAPEYPVYGLQSQGLDGKSTPLATIEEMAQCYLREVRTLQPEGPYYLGGYCMGGIVAYEMAQLLRHEGEDIAMVAMFDTYNLSRALKASKMSMLLQKLKFHAGNIVHLHPGEMIKYAREKIRLARDGELANLLSSRPEFSAEAGITQVESGIEANVHAINERAAELYEPKPYSGRITLFKPQVNYEFYPDPKMGWGDMALDGLDIIELPFNPHAMLVEPYVRILATELNWHIKKLQYSDTLEDAKIAV